MPIKKDGSDEHRHFKTLYEEWIKPIPESHGFTVVRADEIQRTGLITQDVILGLARADLVIADLTDLNPNVYYELGVRHALRGQGTIMLLDETRTQDIPFDIGAYRVVRFTGDMYGLSNLRRKLDAYVEGLPLDPMVEGRDNPVHDSIPSLPIDILSSATGSEEGRLREQLTSMHRLVQKYQQQFGIIGQDREPESSAYRVHALLQAVRDGSFGPDLVKSAHAAAAKQDKEGYLNVLSRIIEDDSLRLDSRGYMTLASDAMNLGLNQAMSIVFDIARRVHSNDAGIRYAELGYFAHSFDPAERRRAREEILRDLGIQVDDDTVNLPAELDDRRMSLLALMLDAYHEDNMNDEAIRITEALIAKFPDNTVVLRNHGRALEEVGRKNESIEWYQRAIWCPNPNDTSAVWLGNELHNRKRYVDALEAYVVACGLDPDDGGDFAHLADEISRGIDDREYQTSNALATRRLPDEIDAAVLKQTIIAAFSCDLLRQEDIDRCVTSAARAGIDSSYVGLVLSIRAGQSVDLEGQKIRLLRPSERRQFVDSLRKVVESDITRRPVDAALRMAHPVSP